MEISQSKVFVLDVALSRLKSWERRTIVFNGIDDFQLPVCRSFPPVRNFKETAPMSGVFVQVHVKVASWFNIEVCRNQWISCGQIDAMVTSVQTSLYLLSFCHKVLEEEHNFPSNRMPQTKQTNEIEICAREECWRTLSHM